MRIKKKQLQEALKKASRFTGDSLPVTMQVLVDGENQLIVATDLHTRFETPVEIKDFERTVAPPAVVYPDDDLKADMEGLSKDQIMALGEYAGVTGKSKKVVVDKIMAASQAKADSEALNNSPIFLREKFCVDPRHLGKIIDSLEGSAEDYITLTPESESVAEGLFGDQTRLTMLAVGDNFQRLMIMPADDFPEWFDVQDAAKVATVSGKDLRYVAGICPRAPKGYNKGTHQPFKEHVSFNAAHSAMVSTDGNRLHHIGLDVEQDVMISAHALEGMAALAKDGNIEIAYSPSVRYATLTHGQDKATVRVDSDMTFPEFKDILNSEQSVTIDVAKFGKLLKQAVLVTGENYRAVELTFNGGLDARVENPERGTYTKESIEFEGNIDPEIKVSINPVFLLEAMKPADKTVQLGLTGAGRPIIVTAEKCRAAIMPMRT